MTERRLIDEKAQSFFEDLWNRGDPWDFESCEFEQAKYERQLEILQDRRYSNAFEIGCGAGTFTRRLSRIADRVLAIDISPCAIAKAREAGIDAGNVDFQVVNIMDYKLREQEPMDLVIMSETIYYLGWLYSFFDVAWLASELFTLTNHGGRLLMANTCGGVEDYLLRPWIVRTYRDLFLNVGYQIETEETFRGTKNGAELDVLISLFVKAGENES